MLSNLKISMKLFLQILIILVCFSAVLGWTYVKFRERIYDEKLLATKHVVQVIHTHLTQYDNRVKTGELSVADAQRLAMQDIRHMRYADNDYFWINDMTPKMIMHPTNPDLNGKDLTDNKDPNGLRIFVEFVRIGREKGEGLLEYQWPKAGQTKPVDKISYVMLFKPWGWIVGSGIYVDDVQKDLAALSIILLSVILAVVFGSLVLAWIVARSITQPVDKMLAAAQKLAEGDIDAKVDVDSKDEIGMLAQAFRNMTENIRTSVNSVARIAEGDLTVAITPKSEKDLLSVSMLNMVDKLKAIIHHVMMTADNVAAGSEELSASSQQLSQGATEQAASAEEVSSSMEQMITSIKQNADNAQQTEKIALKSSQAAQEGGKSVAETVKAMKEIAGKISIIEEMARQTNILALNAAIEAARAGEHGKGFAVVASEVRKLAERSQTAAGEINKLSASSVQIAEQAGVMLDKMVPDIQKTSDLVQEISASSREQDSGAEQINRAIQQLDQVIQQNASASEEMSSTSEELASQAQQLQEAVAFFKIGEDAAGAKPAVKSTLHAGPPSPRRANTLHNATFKQLSAGKHILPASTTIHMEPKPGLNLQLAGYADGADTDFERY